MWITSYYSHHNHQDIATPKKRILHTLKKSAWNIKFVVYYVNKTTCSYFDKNLFVFLYLWLESSSLRRQMTNLIITINKIIPYNISSLTYDSNHQNTVSEIKQNIRYKSTRMIIIRLKTLHFCGGIFCGNLFWLK